MRFFFGFLTLTLLGAGLAAGSVARADSITVVVRPFSGPGSSRVRAEIVKALQKRSVGFVASEDVDEAAERLGVDPEDSTGRIAISRELGISTWIQGAVERDGKFYVANIEILNGADGESMGLMNFEGKRPAQVAKTAGKRLWKDASDLILAGRVPEAMPEVELPPDREEYAEESQRERHDDMRDDDIEEAEEEDDGSEGPSPLDIRVGMVGFSRSLSYTDDLTGLRTYELGMAPAVGVRVHWYPAAHGGEDGIASHIGLDLRGRLAFGLDSALDDTSFPTTARDLGIGLRGRLPLDDSELGLVIGYGHQIFRIDSIEDEELGGRVLPGVPRTKYSMLRVGADARFAMGDEWALGLAAALLPTFGIGQLEEWFPNASATGFEAELAVMHRLSSSLELRVGGGLQRFGYSLDPELEDVGRGPIAGGALDQYISGEIGLTWVM